MAEHNALLRYGSLAVLVVQDTALVLLLRSSREAHADRPMYISSTAVLMMECLKLSCCAGMIFRGVAGGSASTWLTVVKEQVFEPWGMLKLSVPACLYLLQNNLLYFALSHLRATPYKVTYNLKILTGAVFSVAMLGQRLGPKKWGSLVALMAGVSVVQLTKHETTAQASEAEVDGQFLGFLAVLGAAVTSGFCGVYQQRILQRSGGDIWVRNAQMGFTSVVFGMGTVLIKDIDVILDGGFFQGYCPLVWGVILLQSFGGLNVAFILRYADNILKGFAAAFSTVLSCFMEVLFFGFQPTGAFLAGAVLINVAAYLYNAPEAKPKASWKAEKPTTPDRESPSQPV